MSILDGCVRFWILALLAKDKFGDVAMQVILEFGSLMGAVDDPTVVSRVGVCLCTKLEAEIFNDIYELLAPLSS